MADQPKQSDPTRQHGDDPPQPVEKPEAESGPVNDGDGDFRGPYGYGHKAYKPDPKASYTFDMNEPKTLPMKGTTY